MGGEITCNEHGDCAGFKFAAYQFVDSDPMTFEIGKNPIKIHPQVESSAMRPCPGGS